MTGTAGPDGAAVARSLLPDQGAATTVILTETMLGRVLVREYSPSGLFTLGPEHSFAIAKWTETLALDVQARVYEEIVIRKAGVERIEIVSATLRREEAEIVTKGPNSRA